MAMVNGKIVGTKAKKAKGTLKKVKSDTKLPIEEGRDKVKTELETTEIKRPKKKKVEEKAKPKASEPELFRIAIGEHTFLSVNLAVGDDGKKTVEFRKWYNTRNDPEIKQGKGGFNVQPKSSELKLLAVHLKNIAREIDEG